MGMMQQITTQALITPALLALLTIAHEDVSMDMDSGMGTGTHAAPTTSPSGYSKPKTIQCDTPMSYFACGGHYGIIIGHISLMILGWVLILPSCKRNFHQLFELCFNHS